VTVLYCVAKPVDSRSCEYRIVGKDRHKNVSSVTSSPISSPTEICRLRGFVFPSILGSFGIQQGKGSTPWDECEAVAKEGLALWIGPFRHEALAWRLSWNFSHLTALRCQPILRIYNKPPSQPPPWRTRPVHVLFNTCCPRFWWPSSPRVQRLSVYSYMCN
jgi:hypothetical protein